VNQVVEFHHRGMCTIREFGKRVHSVFTTHTRHIHGVVRPGTHRGHGHSIGEGGAS